MSRFICLRKDFKHTSKLVVDGLVEEAEERKKHIPML